MTELQLDREELSKLIQGSICKVFKDIISQTLEPKPEPEKILTIQEASVFLNLSVKTIYNKVSKNELPVMKRSKRLYFSSTELLEYVKSGSRKLKNEIEHEEKSKTND